MTLQELGCVGSTGTGPQRSLPRSRRDFPATTLEPRYTLARTPVASRRFTEFGASQGEKTGVLHRCPKPVGRQYALRSPLWG